MSHSAGLDKQKLAKVLALMESPHDGEALQAARAACRMVRASGLQWSDIVGHAAGPASPERREYVHRYRDNEGREVSLMLDHLLGVAKAGRLAPKPTDFINSVADQWIKTGRLTRRQVDAVRAVFREHSAHAT